MRNITDWQNAKAENDTWHWSRSSPLSLHHFVHIFVVFSKIDAVYFLFDCHRVSSKGLNHKETTTSPFKMHVETMLTVIGLHLWQPILSERASARNVPVWIMFLIFICHLLHLFLGLFLCHFFVSQCLNSFAKRIAIHRMYGISISKYMSVHAPLLLIRALSAVVQFSFVIQSNSLDLHGKYHCTSGDYILLGWKVFPITILKLFECICSASISSIN